MRRFVLVSALLFAFATGAASAQFAPVEYRHQLSESFDIVQFDGQTSAGKVFYLRDKVDPSTCTQVILYGDKVLPVPASLDNCRW